MVGAITTLIVIVAVFLAYNANNGLPFVPVYRVSVVLPNARAWRPTTRCGSAAAGSASSSRSTRSGPRRRHGPRRRRRRRPGTPTRCVAQAEPEARQVGLAAPRDSIFRVRYSRRSASSTWRSRAATGRGARGLHLQRPNDNDVRRRPEILSIDESRDQGADDGTSSPDRVRRRSPTPSTSRPANAIRQNLVGYGGAFAGRGASLNEAIRGAQPAVHQPQAGRADARPTRGPSLAGFFPALGPDRGDRRPGRRRRTPSCSATRRPPSAPISCRPDGAAGDDLGGPPAARSRAPARCARQRPFLADFAELDQPPAPGRQRSSALALPSLNGAITVGTPVLDPQRRHDRQAAAGLHPARRPGRAAGDEDSRSSASRRPSTAPSRSPSTSSRADRLQLLELLLDLLPEHLTERDRSGLAAGVAGRSPQGSLTFDLDVDGTRSVPGVATTVPGEAATGLGGYSASRPTAVGRAARSGDAGQVRALTSSPILHGNPYGPTGQHGNADCQPGQSGYFWATCRVPGQARPTRPRRSRHPRRPGRHRRLHEAATARACSRTPESEAASHERERSTSSAELGRRA